MNTTETPRTTPLTAEPAELDRSPLPVRAPGKKSYGLLSSQYERAAGLKRVWIKNALGEPCMSLKTPAELKSLRQRGVAFFTRED